MWLPYPIVVSVRRWPLSCKLGSPSQLRTDGTTSITWSGTVYLKGPWVSKINKEWILLVEGGDRRLRGAKSQESQSYLTGLPSLSYEDRE